MKLYQIRIDFLNGKDTTIFLEGITENDAVSRLTSARNFVKCDKTKRFIVFSAVQEFRVVE